jgi:hypothetical protein
MQAFILAALTLATPAADDPAAARAVIDKAVQAVGGEKKLARAYTQKASGKFYGPAGPVTFTGEWTVNFPDQLRQSVESEADGMKFHSVKVIAGDKGWLRVNDSVEELDKEALTWDRDQLYAAWIATLLPLKDKEFVLTPLGESKVGERAAVGVKVTHADRPDVTLAFDKEKGWLLRVEVVAQVRNARVRQEIVYDDYQDMGGMKRPKKSIVRRDGKLLVESEVTEFKPLDKADTKQFEKP